MKKKLRTKEDVLKSLNINNFRELSGDKVVKFVSEIQDMPYELLSDCIAHFPDFANQSIEVIEQIKSVCQDAILHASNSEKMTIEGYKTYLSTLQEMISDDSPFEEKMIVAEKMKECCDEIAEIHHKHEDFLGKVLTTVAQLCVLVIAGAILLLTGGKINLRKS